MFFLIVDLRLPLLFQHLSNDLVLHLPHLLNRINSDTSHAILVLPNNLQRLIVLGDKELRLALPMRCKLNQPPLPFLEGIFEVLTATL